MVERRSLSVLPHAVVQVRSYAYVEFFLLLNYVNKPAEIDAAELAGVKYGD
jgi:hypothetical protein